ncbi:MAG: sigma-54 dependent transcriptional regulator [Gammaproteobacteria bacterium]|nr:sigma-54 dependent transcriptional regulator [Gammaproteobacteria bacterium]
MKPAAANPQVLVVDDERDIRELLLLTLRRMELAGLEAPDIAGAKRALQEQSPRLCLTDMRLPDGDGLELVKFAQKRHPGIPIIVITAHGNVESAVRALKAGAFDFIGKPVDLAQLRTLIRNALQLPADSAATRTRLVGNSPAIRHLLAETARLARGQAPVYIHGETGTGKELVARLIHEQGPRRNGRFVPVNCAAIPAELVESELFGHRKGSFTGATGHRDGLFQAADGGSLFLDEITDLPASFQVKLLRAIQERSVRAVGAERERPVDVRILSAAQQPLEPLVASGRFRRDLYYRVQVIALHVPPLRERREDIPPLAAAVLQRLARRADRAPPRLSAAALKRLRRYDYPGNVRELENILERALTLCDSGTVSPEHLRLPAASPQAAPEEAPEEAPAPEAGLDRQLDDVAKGKILAALQQTRWNRTRAAKLLGLSLRALRYRLKKLNLE